MENAPKSNTIATGLAMFSMFFGAGNVVFPLALGQYAQDQNFFAILGLLITAVGVPFAGLIAMTLFDGDYKSFFNRIGKVPGFLVAAIIMGLIGPFGALPRCIALSYSTMSPYLPGLSLEIFSLLSCVIIFLFTFKRNSIVDILGYVLTPLLLVSLGIIIVKGFLTSPDAPISNHKDLDTFIVGLKQGYQTMDLLGAFFFSSVVLVCLKKDMPENERGNYKKLINLTLKASCIGAFLLAVIYIGFSYVAAFNSDHLAGVNADQLISSIAYQVLGPYAGVVVSAAVALACLTTAIALSAVFAEFIHEDVSMYKLGYIPSLLLTLAIAFFVSTFNFMGIAKILSPILHICYPALIVLSFANILYKLYGFKPVKIPVLVVFVGSLLSYIYFLGVL